MRQHCTIQEEATAASTSVPTSSSSNVPNQDPNPNTGPSRPYPQMLQFVSVGPGGSVTNPNIVRSHAIKGYHQKRKEAKKAYLETLNQQRNVQLRPIGILPRPTATSRAGTENSKPSAVSVTKHTLGSRKGHGRDEDVPKAGREKEYESFKDEMEAEIIRREDRQLCLLTTVESKTNNLVPYAWFEKDGPVLYINRAKWPFPTPFKVTGSDRTDQSTKSLTPRQSAWMPYTRSPDFTVVKGAVLDPSVLSWIGESPECFQFRVETIKWIQEQVKDPKKAFNFSTVGAIMTFAMWTAGYGDSAEMSTHMDAVQRIIDARGGFAAFHHEGPIVAKLTLFDSMIAVLTGKAPRFPQVDYYLSLPSPPNTLNAPIHDSPLSGDGDFENLITYHKDIETITSLLKEMWLLTLDHRLQTMNEELTTSRPQISFSADPQHNYNTHLLTLPLLSSCNNPNHNHIIETLQHTSTIYRAVLTSSPPPHSRVDFPSTSLVHPFQLLCTSFSKCTHDDFWVRYPGIQLWVLLVGTAASRGRKEAPFWMFYLSRTGSFSSAANWGEGCRALRLFLDLQRRGREGMRLK